MQCLSKGVDEYTWHPECKQRVSKRLLRRYAPRNDTLEHTCHCEAFRPRQSRFLMCVIKYQNSLSRSSGIQNDTVSTITIKQKMLWQADCLTRQLRTINMVGWQPSCVYLEKSTYCVARYLLLPSHTRGGLYCVFCR